MPELRLAALCVERRRAALALFNETRLEDLIIHHLPSDHAKAITSLTVFLKREIERSALEYLALARPAEKASERVKLMHTALIEVLRAHGIPFLEVSDDELFSTYSEPPLRHREHLRAAAARIWPPLNDRRTARSAIDSALLGLHVQAERLFRLHGVQQ
jgi:hypothetical protein